MTGVAAGAVDVGAGVVGAVLGGRTTGAVAGTAAGAGFRAQAPMIAASAMPNEWRAADVIEGRTIMRSSRVEDGTHRQAMPCADPAKACGPCSQCNESRGIVV
jgi:hypothetical protein